MTKARVSWLYEDFSNAESTSTIALRFAYAVEKKWTENVLVD